MYQKMYFVLFRAITDALEDLERGDSAAAREKLAEAQCQAEDLYIEGNGEAAER